MPGPTTRRRAARWSGGGARCARAASITSALVASLHDVEVRLLAFLDRHYHVAPHASLMGRSPGTVFATAKRAPDGIDEAKLRDALMVRERSRVRRDTTVSVLGVDYELDQGFLAGRLVTAAYSLLDGVPWVEHEGRRLELRVVDPVKDARRKRLPGPPEADASAKLRLVRLASGRTLPRGGAPWEARSRPGTLVSGGSGPRRLVGEVRHTVAGAQTISRRHGGGRGCHGPSSRPQAPPPDF